MSKRTKADWTIATYATHNEAMRLAEIRFQEERDKRYAEGNELRAMALKIKETADAKALDLEKESQAYREARNDAMREQNLKETGAYVTHGDLAVVFSKTEKQLTTFIDEMKTALKPMIAHIAAGEGAAISTNKLYAGITIIVIIIGVIFTFINIVL